MGWFWLCVCGGMEVERRVRDHGRGWRRGLEDRRGRGRSAIRVGGRNIPVVNILRCDEDCELPGVASCDFVLDGGMGRSD